MKKNTDNPARMLGLMGTLGVEIAAFIIGGVYLGRYLDRTFSTEPVCLIIGIFAGMAVGIASALFTLRSFIKD
ncbi:AtpZ/AtpI family protein [Tuberibacillus calidus]|uniref:AtpZ/AtpI family protein n=1 Tax=Tuberibacillus calidus TaxID=340097 RepID=UPI0004029B1D|nr:AtpZ/AtpI family protein [Tuberibacillus calidus]